LKYKIFEIDYNIKIRLKYKTSLLSLSRLKWLNLIGNLSLHGCTKAPARALCNYQLRRSYFIVATAGSRRSKI